jgi:hypothetical protein
MTKTKRKPQTPVRSTRIFVGPRLRASLTAYSKVCAVLAPLEQDQRIRVVKAAAIMLGVQPNV